MEMRRTSRPPIWIPLILLGLLSLCFRFTNLDQNWQSKFYSPETGWILAEQGIVEFLYEYGTWPTLFVGIGAGLFWILARLLKRWEHQRRLGLFLGLLLLIGPGVVVNGIFKDHFGRSRPRQTMEFGGNQPYRALGQPGPEDGGKSFPSGHAATGFFWLGLYIYFWGRNRLLVWGFGLLALIHGLAMGFGRMVQGGHWPSDILWSAGFIYLTAWTLYCILPPPPHPQLPSPDQPPNPPNDTRSSGDVQSPVAS